MIPFETCIYEDERVFASFTTRITTAAERRAALARQADSFGGAVIWPHLVHGTDIAEAGRETLGKGLVIYEDHDGSVTDVPGIALTVTCGDCLPIFAWDKKKGAIGLVHAGWRGTLAGIAAELVYKMQKLYGTDPADLTVRIGPGIDACCFEVKEDCYGLFLDKYPWAEDFMYRRPDGSFTLDLKGINLEILSLCGVEDAEASKECTCCGKERYYSWRRSGERDRMLAYIYLKGSPEGPEGKGFKPALALSRCLTGEPCRYDGASKPLKGPGSILKDYYPVPLCPEQLGGLPTPRDPSEIREGRVIMKLSGSFTAGMPEGSLERKIPGPEGGACFLDVTPEYEKGAGLALRELLANGAEAAVLKSKSPSCGIGRVYDGSFSGTLTEGDGVFASLLKEKGIKLINSEELK